MESKGLFGHYWDAIATLVSNRYIMVCYGLRLAWDGLCLFVEGLLMPFAPFAFFEARVMEDLEEEFSGGDDASPLR